MCFYLFVFFLIFYSVDFTHIFVYFFIFYTLIYFNFNNFFLFFVIKNTTQQQNLKKTNLFFKRLFYVTQNIYKQYKMTLYWKPLFKKISYFGFYRNSINNNINKK